MAKRKAKDTSSKNTQTFEQTLWAAADKLRSHMDAAEYKHVVLGLIFLKYISDSFEELHQKLSNEEFADPEDRVNTWPRMSSGSPRRPDGAICRRTHANQPSVS